MTRKQPKVLREAGARYREGPRQAGSTRARRVTRSYTVVLRWLPAAGRYEVDIPGAPNVFTAGTASVGGSLKRARAALTHHLAWLLEDGEPLPEDRARPKTAGKGTMIEQVRVSLPRQ